LALQQFKKIGMLEMRLFFLSKLGRQRRLYKQSKSSLKDSLLLGNYGVLICITNGFGTLSLS